MLDREDKKPPVPKPEEEQALSEKKDFKKIMDVILEAVQFGGDYEIQWIGSEHLKIRILPKNNHYSNSAEEKLREMGYDVTKSKEPNSAGISTLYFNCEFPTDEIEKARAERGIEINDMRPDEEK